MGFVLLRSYDDYISANIVLGRLREEDINCYLQDEYSVTINPPLSNSIGGIKLMVADTQAKQAEEILNNPVR